MQPYIITEPASLDCTESPDKFYALIVFCQGIIQKGEEGGKQKNLDTEPNKSGLLTYLNKIAWKMYLLELYNSFYLCGMHTNMNAALVIC